MEFTAQVIANFLEGVVEGDPEVKVSTVSKIEEGVPGSLAFLANPKYTPYIYTTNASIVLVNADFVAEQPIKATLVRVKNAYESFASLLQLYAQQTEPQLSGVETPSFIHPSATYGDDFYLGAFAYISGDVRIGRRVKIYPQVFIGKGVIIGDDTTIYPGAVIYHECTIGSNCIIHAGAVIGADGFGFASQEDANYKKIPQIGNVVFEDYVEVGANATVDRATMGSTVLHRGVKIDDHVHIAHNVEVGENTVMAAQCGVAGSAKIGKNCMFGGQVGASPHIKIADGVMAGAQSGIAGDIRKPGTVVLGSPAFDVSKQRRSMAVYKNLPDMANKLNEMQRTIEELKKKLL